MSKHLLVNRDYFCQKQPKATSEPSAQPAEFAPSRLSKNQYGTVRLKQLLSIAIILTTVALFAWYFSKHPNYLTKLAGTNPLVVLWLLAVNAVLISVLTGVYFLQILLADKRLPAKENFLLTIYSSIINFFGPLQSGPGVRAAYLKSKLGISLKKYTLITLIYYGMFAAISAGFLLSGWFEWWQTCLAVIFVGWFSWWVIRRYMRGGGEAERTVKTPLIYVLFAATFAQVSLMVVRYHSELIAVGAQPSILESIRYTGAANFALFVSITPDGIGIRESFLLFAQKIHDISPEHILAASLLDRASYVLFLVILFLIAVAMHAKKRLGK